MRTIVIEDARLEPRFTMRGHAHAGANFCLILEGGFLERSGGKDRSCGPHTLRISRPGTEHDIRTAGHPTRCLVTEFPDALLEPFRRSLGLDRAPSLFVEDVGRQRRMAARLRRIDPDDELMRESWIVEVLAQAARGFRGDRVTGGAPVPAWLEKVRERLEEEPAGPISLGDLARPAGVHPAHLARAFRDHYGRTVGEHLRACRLRLARGLLDQSELSIAEIAFTAGFADQAHLTRSFAERWGIPPGRYRRRLHAARSIQVPR